MSETLNPYSLLRDFSRGQTDAGRALVALASDAAAENADWIGLIEALTVARIAWMQSGEAKDAGPLMGLLGAASCSVVGEHYNDLREQWEAEGIAVASILAEQGEPIADAHLDEVVDSSDASTAALAIEITDLMKEGAE